VVSTIIRLCAAVGTFALLEIEAVRVGFLPECRMRMIKFFFVLLGRIMALESRLDFRKLMPTASDLSRESR
jgi:hypothetical protein